MPSKTIAACTKSINLLAIFDTASIKAAYLDPSQDPGNPTPIDQEGQFLLCGSASGTIQGQGTGNLTFQAAIGDYVNIAGTSIYNNSDDAVIIYGVAYAEGQQVFNAFAPMLLPRSGAVMPDPDTADGIPPLQGSRTFSSLLSRVKSHGTEDVQLSFGLYALADDGETQELFGYYSWNPIIAVTEGRLPQPPTK